MVRRPPTAFTIALATGAVVLTGTLLLLARAFDAKVYVADPRWRDGVSAAARVARVMAANALALAAWIGATTEPGLFEDVSVPLTVVVVGLYVISGITGYRWLRRLKKDPEFKAEWERLMEETG